MANLKDFATGTVLTAPSPANSGNTMLLQNNEHLRMPAVPFYATAHPDNTLPTIDNSEKILVTDINAGTQVMTFLRAQGVASAKNIAAGWRISNTIFAADMYNGTDVRNEVPAGAINGTNTFYMIAAAFTPGSLNVYVNGQRMKSGSGNDYVENATLTGFTMQYALQTGDVLLVDYTIGSSVMMNGVNVRINQEIPTGAVNGSNAAFTTTRNYVSGSLEVYINGLLQAPTTHVTEVSPTAGTFTLDVAPATGDIVRVSYSYAVSTGGNAASVNGLAANATPTANQLFALDGNAQIPQVAFKQIAFSAYDNNTNQSLGNGVFTHVAFATEAFDTGDYNAATSYFTPTVAGYYLLSTAVGIATGGDQSTMHLALRKNNTNVQWTRTRKSGAGEVGAMTTAVVYANGTTDTFDVAVYTDGGATNINGSQQNTWFTGAKVGV